MASLFPEPYPLSLIELCSFQLEQVTGDECGTIRLCLCCRQRQDLRSRWLRSERGLPLVRRGIRSPFKQMGDGRESPAASTWLLRLRGRRETLRDGREVQLHNRELKVRGGLLAGEPVVVPDEERLRDGDSPRCSWEESVLYGVEERTEAGNIRSCSQLLEDGSDSGDGELEHRVPVRNLEREAAAVLVAGRSRVPDVDL